MQYQRWYDKNELLKYIMEAMENTDASTRNAIANDIIQLIVEKQYDVDDFIQIINNQSPVVRKRWYDEDEAMHSAVAMIKNIDDDEKLEVLKEIYTTIIDFNNERLLENPHVQGYLQ
jgi:hypothetical protein